MYEYNEASRRWIRIEAVSTVTEAVHDIAFAPNIGRSYHVLVRLGLVSLKVAALIRFMAVGVFDVKNTLLAKTTYLLSGMSTYI